MNHAKLRQCNTPPTTTITYCIASLKSAYAAPVGAKILCFLTVPLLFCTSCNPPTVEKSYNAESGNTRIPLPCQVVKLPRVAQIGNIFGRNASACGGHVVGTEVREISQNDYRDLVGEPYGIAIDHLLVATHDLRVQATI
jgi:hypothetical protein